MSTQEKFKSEIDTGYSFKKGSITLGGAMYKNKCLHDVHVKIPLKTINRHGLIAGATGTGKTKTLQVMAEQFSNEGIPVLLMDLKGDLSGLAKKGTENPHITSRHNEIKLDYNPKAFPIEFYTLQGDQGVKLRSTISEFGPVLLSKILDLNDTQEGVIALLFQYCDNNGLPLIDLKDLKKTLQYAIGEGKSEMEAEYGQISSTSVNTILRKIMALEQQGGEQLFGEPSFEINDLVQTEDGMGVINIISLSNIQDRPQLFSTFMLSLLSEIYSSFPEQGDADKPKLVLFIDEAHLFFSNASSALLQQIEMIIKLIRSKGVGLFFCTQNPTDIPDSVLSQLGLKIQHALRAFTEKDRKSIKKSAENYPRSAFYQTDEVLTQLGIGEAFVTALNEKGIPTPLVRTLLRAPLSSMDVLDNETYLSLLNDSDLIKKYNLTIDRDSAYEILNNKLKQFSQAETQKALKTDTKAILEDKNEPGFLESLTKNTMVRQLGRTIMRELTRGLLGSLGVKTKATTTRRSSRRRY